LEIDDFVDFESLKETYAPEPFDHFKPAHLRAEPRPPKEPEAPTGLAKLSKKKWLAGRSK
jgi:hypothetical protein